MAPIAQRRAKLALASHLHLGLSPTQSTGCLPILFVHSIWFIDNVVGYTLCVSCISAPKKVIISCSARFILYRTSECPSLPAVLRLSFSGPLLFLQTGTLDYSFLSTSPFSEKRQTILWLLFFTSFAVKVPMVPFHRPPWALI